MVLQHHQGEAVGQDDALRVLEGECPRRTRSVSDGVTPHPFAAARGEPRAALPLLRHGPDHHRLRFRQVLRRDPLNVGRADGVELVQVRFQVVDVMEDDRLRDQVGEVVDTLAGEDERRQGGPLDPPQLGVRHRLGGEPLQFLEDNRLGLGPVLALKQLELDREPAGVATGRVAGPHVVGKPLRLDQPTVQPRGLTAGQDVLDQVEHEVVRLARPDGVEPDHHPRHVELRRELLALLFLASLLRGCRLPLWEFAFGDVAEQLLDQRQRLVRVEPAGDDQGRVVRVVPLVVVPLDDLRRRGPDVLLLADDRVRVRRLRRVEQRQDRLVLQVPRPVLVPL